MTVVKITIPENVYCKLLTPLPPELGL